MARHFTERANQNQLWLAILATQLLALILNSDLCQKGRDSIIQEELYEGTSKSAEGYGAPITFGKAKEEGMQITIHWQDADSSANAVAEVFPEAEIMTCAGHAGRTHLQQLERGPNKNVLRRK